MVSDANPRRSAGAKRLTDGSALVGGWRPASTALFVAIGLFSASQVCAQAKRSGAAGAFEGLGRAMQDIGAAMQQEAEARDREQRLRDRLAAEEQLRRDEAARVEVRRALERQRDELKRSIADAVAPRTGSGFAFLPRAIITNYHVIAGSTKVTALSGDGREFKVSPVLVDPEADLAVLEILGAAVRPLAMARDGEVRKGARAFVVGFPQPSIQGLDSKITEGIVNSLTGMRGENERFQLSAEVQPGNSGGPVFGQSGTVIGVVVSRLSSGQNVNYAIKPTAVHAMLKACQCEEHLAKSLPKVQRAKTGLQAEDIASLAEPSVFLIRAKPSEQTAARIASGRLLDATPDDIEKAIQTVEAYHPGWRDDVRRPTFKSWLSQQEAAVRADFERVSIAEIAIRVLDRFYGRSGAFPVSLPTD